MTTRYAHPVTVVNRRSVTIIDFADWANITDDKVFDTGGNMGLVLQAYVTGSISGTDPVLRLRVDHSVDGQNWSELHEFDPWNNETGVRTFVIPQSAGPLVCAQYVRLMAKCEGASASFLYFEVKASLKG